MSITIKIHSGDIKEKPKRDKQKQQYYMKRYYEKKEYIPCNIGACSYSTKRNTDLKRHKKLVHNIE